MRQLAMRYDAGEGLASILTNLAVLSQATSKVSTSMHTTPAKAPSSLFNLKVSVMLP